MRAKMTILIVDDHPSFRVVAKTVLETDGFAVDGTHASCGVSSLTFTAQTNGGAGWTVPGTSSLPVTLANSLAMNTSAASACQGATFTVYLRAGL